MDVLFDLGTVKNVRETKLSIYGSRTYLSHFLQLPRKLSQLHRTGSTVVLFGKLAVHLISNDNCTWIGFTQ